MEAQLGTPGSRHACVSCRIDRTETGRIALDGGSARLNTDRMEGNAHDPVVEELRAVRAELAALRAEVREAIRRSEPWTDERRDAFVESLRAAAAEGEASGFSSAEQVCEEMAADIEAVERERRKCGA